jgi:hypothetical protein
MRFALLQPRHPHRRTHHLLIMIIRLYQWQVLQRPLFYRIQQSVPGRIYRIVNYSGDGNGGYDITFSIGVYTCVIVNGTTFTTGLHTCVHSIVQLTNKTGAVTIQNDGNNWYVNTGDLAIQKLLFTGIKTRADSKGND